jgi:hypothetical protein
LKGDDSLARRLSEQIVARIGEPQAVDGRQALVQLAHQGMALPGADSELGFGQAVQSVVRLVVSGDRKPVPVLVADGLRLG